MCRTGMTSHLSSIMPYLWKDVLNDCGILKLKILMLLLLLPMKQDNLRVDVCKQDTVSSYKKNKKKIKIKINLHHVSSSDLGDDHHQ